MTRLSKKKNLSSFPAESVPGGKGKKIGIVVSGWNPGITSALWEGAVQTLLKYGVNQKDILLHHVPGSFELPFGAMILASKKKTDAVICLGCIIRGETKHFDFIAQACATGIMQVGLTYRKPVIFGVLTTENMEQAMARAGGKHGNKGVEAAITALQLIG
ncbi:MAG: 6,7-dimethyl-8-ribityllumazine synthase [Bacteroidia bacterium]|nr:6,7-dimethyl-8-ribityllumazine synthase [Bacteroidia bacterium]